MGRILLGKGEQPVYLHAQYGNRHGLVAGATGTGKTVSLMVLAEGFSRLGVPVFMADVKGDVAGLAMPGSGGEKIQRARARRLASKATRRKRTRSCSGICTEKSAIRFARPSARSGRRCSAGFSISAMRRSARSRSRSRWPTTAACCCSTSTIFARCSRSSRRIERRSRRDTASSARSPLRRSSAALLSLEREGGEALFGEPALELTDLLRTDLSGRGIINVLAADQLILKPRLFSSFLLWLLSELFENLPEVGDLDKPKLVFMFDEAHLLFDDAPPALRDRVEQVVRIIRSKGVGVYFCSQFPDDVPGEILGQLGNRVQHALRAFTPRDQKAVRTAAETFVANPKLDVAKVISTLAVGEALVSTLQEGGVPMPVQRTMMAPPRSRIGAITAEERATVRARSPIGAKYDTPVNRESAYEMLNAARWVQRVRRVRRVQRVQRVQRVRADVRRVRATRRRRQPRTRRRPRSTSFSGARSAVRGWSRRWPSRRPGRSGASSGRQILRGILGGILGSKRTR